MKKQIALFCISFLSTLFLFAQDFTYFNKKIQIGNTPYPSSVVYPLEDGYMTISTFEIAGIKALMWAKLGSDGEILETRFIDQDDRILEDIATGDLLLQHPNGNYYLSYAKRKTDNEDDVDIALLSFNAEEDALIKKEYGTDKKEIPTFLVATPDKGFLLGGIQDPDGNAKYYVVKIDAKGEIIWEKTYGTNVVGNASMVVRDETYFLFGTTETRKNGRDMLLTSISSIGITNWTKTYGEKTDDTGLKIGLLPKTGYMIAGRIEEKGEQKQYYAIVDEKGEVVAKNTYFVEGIGNLETQLLPVLDGKGFIGVSSFTNKDGYKQPLIMRIDDEAKVLWSISSLTPTAKADVYVKDIEVGKNKKGYVLTGYNPDAKLPYGWVASFDYTGVHCSTFACDSTNVVTEIKDINVKPTVEVVTNPVNAVYHINYNFPKLEKIAPSFYLYNLAGEQVVSTNLDVTKQTMSMSTSDLPSGMYIYITTYRGIKVASGKLIVK
ncbi:MAG: T9SS type A sorting domain-containing protein [Chitinophagales bacterium]